MDIAIDRAKRDAIDRAKRGDLEFFMDAPLNILLKARDSNDDTVLSIVVYYNRLDCCEVICRRCPSLLYHQTGQGGNTPLHSAAHRGNNLDILKLLIRACNKQKTLTLTTSYGSNAMHKAVYGHQPGSIKLLIEADPNNELLKAGDCKKNTPLHLAVENSEHAITRLLIKADPDFHYGTNSTGKTPLLMAIDKAESQNHREMIKLILELQPTQSMVKWNENGWTALHYSVYKRKLDATGLIIQSCPESSIVADNEGRNFFHLAVKTGNVNMVKHILELKEITSTVLNSPDNLGRTPFDVAAESENERMILCLHEDSRVNKKLTVTKNLQWIVKKHNFVMMNVFMERNADFLMNIELEVFQNSIDREGDTILFKAAQENHLFLCKELYKICPSLICHQSKGGRTALHHAAWRGEPEMLKFLIAAGANSYAEDHIESGGGEKFPQKMLLTMLDEQGCNALHRAVLNHKVEAVKLLVEADPNKELLRAANRQKNTALHLAVRLKSDHDIARLLIEADPDFSYGANSDRKTPLLIGIDREERNKDRELLKLILERQPTQCTASVNENGWTALHYCVSKKNLRTIGYIIKSCPESSEVADNKGQNFFHHAVKLGSEKMVKHILGMKEITSTILSGPDNLGRTPLDVAALTGQEGITLCLLEDPRVDKKLGEAKHLQWVVEKHNFAMMNLLIEANPDFIKKIDLEVLLNSRDGNGDTILFKAVQENHFLLCKEIYNRCPSLIYHQSKDGRTAMHNAAWTGEAKMLKFLITAGAKSYNENEEEDIECGGGEKIPQKMLLTMLDELGDTALHKAVLNHKLEAVKLLILADIGFEYTTNKSGENPLMIAIRESQSNENARDSGKIRKLLFEKLPNQAKARTGDKKWTLLHHAAQNGNISVIEDIIEFCSSCLEQVDNENKNFLHIAAKWEKVQVVKHVLGAKKIADSVLNHRDNEGNTPFHIAAQTRNEDMTRHFLYDRTINKDTVNNIGQHVLHEIKFPYDKTKAGVVGIVDTVDESDLKDQSDFDLVVGALIATVSFTAGITVPGGYNSEGPNQGMAVLSKEVSFAVFIISNTFALIFSLYAVFSHFCARRMREEPDIIYQLNVAKCCTLAAMYCMMVAFIAGSFAVLANSNWLPIVVCIIGCLFFIFACPPMWKIAMQRKRAPSASQHYDLVSPS